MGEIDSDADRNDEALRRQAPALQQNAGELAAVGDEVVGPFEANAAAAEVLDRATRRQPRDKAELGRVGDGAGIDEQRAAVKIAGRRAPLSSVPAAPGGLSVRDDPQLAGI